MQVCEAKGDFSFIYTTGARSTLPHQGWRPADGTFRPVLPWLYCFGEGQAGKLHHNGLELQKVLLLSPAPILTTTVESLLHITNYKNNTSIEKPIGHILNCMRKIGFTGCGQVIELESGYFFPLMPENDLTNIEVLVASGIQWTFGAPGILVKPASNGTYKFHGAGVFAGKLGDGVETVVIT